MSKPNEKTNKDAFVRIRRDTYNKLNRFRKAQRISFIESARVAADALESLPETKQREIITGRELVPTSATR